MIERRDDSLAQVGALCCFLLALSYLAAGAAYWVLPPEQRWGSGPDQFLASFARSPTPLTVYYWATALGALAGLGAIPAIGELVRAGHEGWVRWASNLAYLGFAVAALSSFRALALVPAEAAHFVGADAPTRTVLAWQNVHVLLDPHGWLPYGAVGLWMLVLSTLALRARTLPAPLGCLGIAGAALYGCVVAGLALRIETLVALAAGLGGVVVAPLWYVWVGRRLRAVRPAVRAPAAA